MLGGEQPREVVVFGLDQLQELEHDAGAALRIGRGPGRAARPAALAIAFSTSALLAKRDLGLHLAGVGIEHVAAPAGGALDLLAADEMADLAHHFLLRTRVPRLSMAGPSTDR